MGGGGVGRQGGLSLLGPQDADMRIHLKPRPPDPYSYLGMFVAVSPFLHGHF